MDRETSPFRFIRLAVWVLVVGFGLGQAGPATAQDASPVAAEEATPAASPPTSAATSPEQQLADRYAPILNIKKQSYDCDTAGEAYLPIVVEATLGAPEVRLMRKAQAGESGDVEVMRAPTAQDLYGLDDTYYLDLPGNSRQPGCGYEEWSGGRIAELGLEPSVYARIATEPDRPGELALQYWFYWVFDNFNNTHESDWEMIQFTFEADSAAEALEQDPAFVAFAQHGGGEEAEWDDDKLQRDGTHVNVYFAAESHASYYQDALWIGWGEQGSGFGCDPANPDSITLPPPRVVLLPDTVTADSAFAWLNFGGRWGERHPWEFNGPLSPNAGTKWDTPISWTDDLRQFSLAVPHNATIGPGPAQLFCSISGTAGSLAAFSPLHPRLVIALSAVALVAVGFFVFWARLHLGRAIGLYFRHPGLFLVVSVFLLVVASIATALADIVNDFQPSGSSDGGFGLLSLGPGIGIGSFQGLLLSIFVAPLIIYLTFAYASEVPEISLRSSWRPVLSKWFTLLKVLLLNALITALLALTIVLIPVAIYKSVQWFFSAEAVILDDCGVREARHRSRVVVRHNWWRTFGMSVLVALVSGIPGPVIGMALFVTSVVSVETAGLISGLVYAIAYPIAVIASTLLYIQLWAVADGQAAPLSAGSWWKWPRRDQPEASGEQPGTARPVT